jgi:hypothetical protein
MNLGSGAASCSRSCPSAEASTGPLASATRDRTGFLSPDQSLGTGGGGFSGQVAARSGPSRPSPRRVPAGRDRPATATTAQLRSL